MKSFLLTILIVFIGMEPPLSLARQSPTNELPAALEFRGFREVIRPLPGKTATRPEISALKLISDGTRLAARPGSAPTRDMVRQQMAELEAFLVSNPDSAYGADLRRQLARYYRSIGRYSLSLERWREALNETLQFTEGFGKEIADESLAERMSILASLGRADELQEIKDQMRGRRLDGGFRTMQFRTALESLAMMRRRPEISFRCGPFAVAEVARRLTGNWVSGISGAESPETGFSAYELVRLANGAGINLRAAWRESGDAVVVPSVVHWGDDHYAALVELREGEVLVVDPTFQMQSWLDIGDVSAEASGVFLIPANSLPRGWRWLSDDESKVVFGKGFPTLSNPGNDGGGGGGGGCEDETGDEGEAPTQCCGGPGGGGGGKGGRGGRGSAGNTGGPGTPGPVSGPDANGEASPDSDCTECQSVGDKMPIWWVGEPWLNLWLYDRPYVYKPKYGPAVRLELMYKSRQATFVGGYSRLGQMLLPLWKSPWLARAGQNPYDGSQVVLMGADGRELTYWASETDGAVALPIGYDSPGTSFGKPIPVTLTVMYDGATPLGYEAVRPNGWREQYTNAIPPVPTFALSALISPQGETIRFLTATITVTNYGIPTQLVRLDRVVAPDGAETQLYYDNSSYPQTITRIVGPQGQTTTLTYDDNQSAGNLATITDVGGILSRIDYDATDLPASLITPYGTTSFTVEDNTGYDGHTYTNQIDRAVTVVEPGSVKQVYALINSDNTGQVPSSPPSIPTATTGEPGWVGTLDTALANQRNSFYWGRAASPYLTNSLSSLSAAEFKYARIRHWSSYGDDGSISSFVGNVLQWQRAGSPDGSAVGPAVWYDYTGKPTGSGGVLKNYAGTNNLPSVVAWVMPDGTTRYIATSWNEKQRPLQTIERWIEGGTPLYRTNSYTYDTNGEDLLVHTGPSAVFLAGYAYDGNGRVIRMTNAVSSEVTKYTYDASGRVTSVLTPSGNLTTNTFSVDGLTRTTRMLDSGVAYRTNSRARTLGVVYSRVGLNSTTLTNVTTWVVETNPYGLSVTNIYDALGRLWERRWPQRQEWFHYELAPSQSYASSTGGKLIVDLTARVNVIGGTNYNSQTFTYDALRRKAFVGEPNGTLTEYQYCDCGAVSQVTRGYGLGLAETTYYQHDLLGRLIYLTQPGGSVTTNAYDARGRLTSTSDALGTHSRTYDNLNRLKTTSNAWGTTGTWLYDPFDRVISLTDRNGVITTNRYDAAGRMTSRALVGGGTESWSYTANVRGPTSYTNQISKVTQYTYHSAGWKTNEVTVGVMTNRFVYNGAGDLVRLWDGNQSVATSGQATNGTVWIYDQYGRVQHKVYANNVTNLTYSFDALGRLTNRWSQSKGNTEYRYDVNGNVTTVNYPAGTTDLTYSYDALNRMTNMVDAVGTTKYTYANGLLASEDGPWSNDTVSLSYQNARERSQLVLIQPTGNAWTNSYGWDADHRLSTVTSPAGTHTYTYNSQGSLVRKLALPGGRYITNTFDSLARVIDTSVMTNSSGTFFNRHGYAYNNAHQRTTISRTNSSATGWNGYSTITYDDAGQVRTVSGFNGSGVSVPADNFAYGYDAGWNMLKRTNNVTVSTYTPNVLNQAAGSYDNNGNRTSGTESYTYDAENQLVSVEQASSWKLEYLYDGHQRLRVVKDYEYSGGGGYSLKGETRYVYDGMLILQERSSSGHPLVTYSRGRDLSGSFDGAGGIGGLVARTAHATSSPYQPSTHAYYHADGNGNVTYLTRGDGSSVGGYKFDPFGRLVSSTGTLASGNTMRFSSKLWSQSSSGSTGLYYYGYRFFDPTSQRWMNRDPVGEVGGFNLFAFNGNRPINRIDTWGLMFGLPEKVGIYCGLLAQCYEDVSNAFWGAHDWATGKYGPHHPTPGSPTDQMTHCVGACEAKKSLACQAAGINPENRIQAQEGSATSGRRADQIDYANNEAGFGIAASGEDCKIGCMRLLSSGRLEK